MLKPGHAAMAAIMLTLAGCQQSNVEQPEAEGEIAAQLPAREAGATTVLTTASSMNDGVEVIVQDAVFAPDAQLPLHYHPGDETLYMIEGTVTLMQQGQAPLTLVAGDAHLIPALLAHDAKAGPHGARAVIYRAHPQGEEIRYLVTETEGVSQ